MLCRRRSSCTVVPLPKNKFLDNGNRHKAPVKAMRRAVPQRPTRDCISGPGLHMNKWGIRFQPPPVSSRLPAGCLSAEVSSFNPPCSPPRSAVVSGGRYKIYRSSANAESWRSYRGLPQRFRRAVDPATFSIPFSRYTQSVPGRKPLGSLYNTHSEQISILDEIFFRMEAFLLFKVIRGMPSLRAISRSLRFS